MRQHNQPTITISEKWYDDGGERRSGWGWGRVFDLFYVGKNNDLFLVKINEYLAAPTYPTTSKKQTIGTASNRRAFMVGVIVGIQRDPPTCSWVNDYVVNHNWLVTIKALVI